MPFVQYIACLAVIAALDQCFASRLGPQYKRDQLPFRIKWPNDIYCHTDEDKTPVKVGGVLCQTLLTQGTYSMAIGLGLNVSNDEPTTCVNAQLARFHLQASNGAAGATRAEVLALTLNNFEDMLQV